MQFADPGREMRPLAEGRVSETHHFNMWKTIWIEKYQIR